MALLYVLASNGGSSQKQRYPGYSAPAAGKKNYLNFIFNPNGGTWKSSGTTLQKVSSCYFSDAASSYIYFERVINSDDTVTKSGQVFQGWQCSGTTYQDQSSITVAGAQNDLYLTAVWGDAPAPPSTTSVRVEYNAGEGTFTAAYGGGSTTYAQGTVSALTSTFASGTKTSGYATDGLYLHGNRSTVLTPPTGMVFKGWKHKEGRLGYSDSQVNFFTPTSASAPYTVVFEALWEEDADQWDTLYSGQNYKVFSGNLTADYGNTRVYWKLLLLEKGNDYTNNTSQVYYDFRVKSVRLSEQSYNIPKDSRQYNYFQLTLKPGTDDTGSDIIGENFTSRNTSTYRYNKIEGGVTTSKYMFSPFASAGQTNYLTLTEEENNSTTRPSGSAGIINWPHRISSDHSLNGVGSVKVNVRYYRTESECYGQSPFAFDINYTSTEDFVLGKFNRQVNYNDNNPTASNTSSQEKQFNTTLTLAAAPTWSGHTFNCWKCVSDLGTTYSASASFTDNSADENYTALTMDALWNATTTISLGTGASATSTSINVVTGDIISVTNTAPYQLLVNGVVASTVTVSSGYAFNGWTLNGSPVTGDITVSDNFTLTFTTRQLGDIEIYIQKDVGMGAGEFIESGTNMLVDAYNTWYFCDTASSTAAISVEKETVDGFATTKLTRLNTGTTPYYYSYYHTKLTSFPFEANTTYTYSVEIRSTAHTIIYFDSRPSSSAQAKVSIPPTGGVWKKVFWSWTTPAGVTTDTQGLALGQLANTSTAAIGDYAEIRKCKIVKGEHPNVELYKTGKVTCSELIESAGNYYILNGKEIYMPEFIEYT